MISDYRTPRGAAVRMHIRPDTNDHNVCVSCLNEDEYGLRDIHLLTGRALDIGAHIGAVTVALLIDNPEIQVTAIEPVPENVELLRVNLEENGLSARCKVIAASAGGGLIAYRYQGDETARIHRFIGNQPMSEGTTQTLLPASRVKDRDLVADFAKIDCEGCEWDILPALRQIPYIVGELHPRGGTRADLEAALPEHHISFARDNDFTPFTAVR